MAFVLPLGFAPGSSTSPSGEHYFPAFPYTSYQHMKVDDARDLFAYVRTLPAVAGKAPAHQVPFPFNIRRNLGVWKALFMDFRQSRTAAGRAVTQVVFALSFTPLAA